MKKFLMIIINFLFLTFESFQKTKNIIKINFNPDLNNLKIIKGENGLGTSIIIFVVFFIILFGIYYILKCCRRKNRLQKKDIYEQIIKMDFNQILV